MRISAYIKRFAERTLIVAASLFVLVSCDNVIYDDEGDCSVTYRLRFRYDKNLKWADAFANEVKSVHLYAFDPQGVLAWQKSESGSALASEGYAMTLDLPAGDYHLIAWCGLDNEDEKDSFSVPDMIVGTSRMEELQCRLNRLRDADNAAYSKERLDFLFHGELKVSLPENEDGGDYLDTMYLVKDVNHVRVILQHLSGEDVDVNEFSFTIEDENGLMDYDNSLLSDENIFYKEWNKQTGTAGIGKEDMTSQGSRSIIYVNGAIADLTVGRMMEAHRKKMVLTITNNDGETVAKIPVIDYALLAKDYYEQAYGHRMNDQEFLDREDEYVMTLFLDENNQWESSSILIHAWRVVPSNVDLH